MSGRPGLPSRRAWQGEVGMAVWACPRSPRSPPWHPSRSLEPPWWAWPPGAGSVGAWVVEEHHSCGPAIRTNTHTLSSGEPVSYNQQHTIRLNTFLDWNFKTHRIGLRCVLDECIFPPLSNSCYTELYLIQCLDSSMEKNPNVFK